MKNINTVLLGILAIVGIVIGVEVSQLVVELRQDITKTQSEADHAFATLNQTLEEQRGYFKKEQDLLNSPEIQGSVALGFRSLRNFDKATIGLDLAMVDIQKSAASMREQLPQLLASLNKAAIASGESMQTVSHDSGHLLENLGQQISDTSMVLQDQLEKVTPVLSTTEQTIQSLNQTALGLNELVRNPAINTSLTETAGTMTELHGTAANLRALTKPQNMYLQAGVALFKFTGLKWLTGFFIH